MKQTEAPPNIVRRIAKIERAEVPPSNNEYLYRVWYEDVEGEFADLYYKEYYEYVWAKDEMQAYIRVMHNKSMLNEDDDEKTKHNQDTNYE